MRGSFILGSSPEGGNSLENLYWKVSGNNTGLITKKLGTISNSHVHIVTNNTPIGTWFSTGQWGIGLTDADTPAAKLHIDSGAALTSPIIRLENNTVFADLFASNATPEGAITATRGAICLVNDGAAGSIYVKASGTGNTGWSLLGSGGGSTPGGSNTQVQYNNAGAFGGVSGATSDGTNLFVPTLYGGSSSGGNITISSTSNANKGKIYLGTANLSYFDENTGTATINVNNASTYSFLSLKQSSASGGAYITWLNNAGTEKGYILYNNGSAGTRPDQMAWLHAAAIGGLFIDSSGRTQVSTYSHTAADTAFSFTVDSLQPTGAVIGMVIRRADNTADNGVPIAFKLHNSSGAYVEYGTVQAYIISNTAGTHSGGLVLTSVNAGSSRRVVQITTAASNATTIYYGNGNLTSGDGILTMQHTGSQTGGAPDLPGSVWNIDGAWGTGTAAGGSLMFRITPPAAGSANTANAAANRMEILGNGKGIAIYQDATPLTAAAVTDGFVISSFDASGAGTASMKITNENGSNIKLYQNTGWTLPTGTPTKGGWDTSTATLTNVAETVKAILDHLLTNMEILHS